MIKNTAPLVKDGKRLTRKFLGNLFPENCYENNELKAYVAGKSKFAYGRDENGNQRYYSVRQEYSYI